MQLCRCNLIYQCWLTGILLCCVAFAKTWSPSCFCFCAGKLFPVSTLEFCLFKDKLLLTYNLSTCPHILLLLLSFFPYLTSPSSPSFPPPSPFPPLLLSSFSSFLSSFFLSFCTDTPISSSGRPVCSWRSYGIFWVWEWTGTTRGECVQWRRKWV